MNEVCVIGGSRYFGRRLIALLLEAGVRVTIVNRGSSAAPEGVTHLVADRDDEAALVAALGERTFDVVFDQVCYTPVQAAIARRVFRDRTRRYVMTSTIEVYDRVDGPTREESVDPLTWPALADLPWGDPRTVEDHYGEGKRQAEAVFMAEPGFTFVSVRCSHVLGGDDFTGRFEHYVERIREGREILLHPGHQAATFISCEEIAAFLFWTAGQDFAGPVNACSTGDVDVTEICELIAAHDLPLPLYRVAAAGEQASPFSFGHYYGMDNSRAARLGFPFSKTADWLPGVVAAAVGR